MAKHGLAIMIADKMPPPGKGGSSKDDYAEPVAGDGKDEGGDGDETMELDTMRDFRQCLKSGDDEQALAHLKDLISMLGSPEEKDE
jgi:hypothetical protein